MEISESLFKFLVNFDIIPQEATRLNNQLVRLPKEISVNFENAKYFAKLAKQINRIECLKLNQPEQQLPNLGSLKEGNAPAAKLFNWNIVLSYFLNYDISVHPDQRTLIAAGDHQAATHVLNTVHQYVVRKYPDYSRYVQKTPLLLQSPQKQKEREKLDTIDLKRMQVEKDPLQTTSSLELLTILISKCLHLTPSQAASLFTENCKYLAHVIVKGVKGLFDPIIMLYQQFNSYSIHLLDLSSRDTKFINFIFNALKPGLVSKSDIVGELACNFFFNCGVEMNKRQLSNKAWDWFINENNSGLYVCIKSMKRHPKLCEEIIKIFYQFGQYNFVELFTTYLKVEIPDTKDHMHFICQIIQPISSHPFILSEILQNGIMEDWLDIAFECSQAYIQTELRLQALNFLAECWINHPKKIEEVEARATQIIDGLVEGCNDSTQSVLLGIDCLGQLFRLLKKLGQEKNSYAPKIYKAVSEVLISQIDNINLREFSLVNFTEIFKEIPQIPVSIMLEPYLSRIQGSEEIFQRLNVCDFVFLSQIAHNSKLNVKLVVQVLDLLGKVLLNNIIFSNIVHMSLSQLLNQYLDNQEVQVYINKFIKITLAMYYASEKKKKPKEKILPLYNNQAASKSLVLLPNDIEIDLINAQKRTKTVDVLKSIADLHCREVNQKMKPLVAHTAIQLEDFFKKENIVIFILPFIHIMNIYQFEKSYYEEMYVIFEQPNNLKIKNQNKGMMRVLESFGNPQEIIQEYRMEYEQHMEQQRKEQDEKEALQELENLQNMDEDERKVTENVRKYGLGLKKKKTILTKEEQYRLAQLRKPQETDPKVLQILEDKKKEYLQKQENDQKKKETENQQLEKQKQLLRKQLEKRSIQQGVATQNKHDMEANLLFDFNSREKEMKKEKKSGILEIAYFDLNLEEQRDQTMVDILLKKYHKLFRHLFIKYSNSTQTFDSKIQTFDKLKDRTSTMTIAEAWKIIKDYELTLFISQEEHKSIFRIININYFNKKTDLQQLDFKGFEQFIIQLSYHFCSKPPQDLRHLPISCSIEKLIDYMKTGAKKQGQNVSLFENPDKQFFGEAEVIEEFNKKLKEDPNSELPDVKQFNTQEGYKKVQEKELKFNYSINPKLNLPLGMKYGFEILNEILIQNLGIIEPKTQETSLFKAQPLVKAKVNTKPQYLDVFKDQENQRELQKQNSKSPSPKGRQRITSTDQNDANGLSKVQLKIGNKVMNPILSTFGVQNKKRDDKNFNNKSLSEKKIIMKQSIKTQFEIIKKYGSKRVLEIDQFKQLPVSLKVEVTKQSLKDRYTSEQVAFVLDDILDAVEQGKTSIRKQGLQGVQNHFQKSKEDQGKEKEQETKSQMKRIKERKVELSDQLEKNKKLKEEEDQKKKDEEKKKQEEAQKKKLHQEMKQKQSHQEQKSKISEYNKQKEEQKMKEQDEKLQQEKEKRKKHNEQFGQYNQNKQQKLREDWQKKKQVSAEKQSAQEIQEEKQKSHLKKLHKKILEDNQERLEIEAQQNSKIQQFLESPETEDVFRENENVMNLLFEFLERYTFKQITNPTIAAGEIPLKVFSWFCFHFNLYPEIISPNEVILIFRSLTKHKHSINGAPIGLNKQEFQFALARISIKGAKVFNKFNEKQGKNNGVEEKDMEQILKENEEEQIEKKKQEDQQQDVNNDAQQSSAMQINSSKTINSPTKGTSSTNKIIDQYTYIDQTSSLTLQALINYLGIPPNKAGANNFFKQKLQDKHIPDSVRKRELLKKINHDPQEFISFKSPDKNISKMSKNDQFSKKSGSPDRESQSTSILLNNQMTPERQNNKGGIKNDRSKSPQNVIIHENEEYPQIQSVSDQKNKKEESENGKIVEDDEEQDKNENQNNQNIKQSQIEQSHDN